MIDFELQGKIQIPMWKFTPFLVYPQDNMPPIEDRTTKGKSDLTSFKNLVYLYHFGVFEIISRHAKVESVELFHTPQGSAYMLILICIPTGLYHGPWKSLVAYIHWNHWISASYWLCDWHWSLQAATNFRQIIHSSNATILYADIW